MLFFTNCKLFFTFLSSLFSFIISSLFFFHYIIFIFFIIVKKNYSEKKKKKKVLDRSRHREDIAREEVDVVAVQVANHVLREEKEDFLIERIKDIAIRLRPSRRVQCPQQMVNETVSIKRSIGSTTSRVASTGWSSILSS
jgi:predicted membrane protein